MMEAEHSQYNGGFGNFGKLSYRKSHRHASPLCFNIFHVAEILGCFSAVANAVAEPVEAVEAIAEKRWLSLPKLSKP